MYSLGSHLALFGPVRIYFFIALLSGSLRAQEICRVTEGKQITDNESGMVLKVSDRHCYRQAGFVSFLPAANKRETVPVVFGRGIQDPEVEEILELEKLGKLNSQTTLIK